MMKTRYRKSTESRLVARSSYVVYGLVTLGFIVMFISSSMKSIYQVYFSSLADYFNYGRSGFAWSGSIFMLVTGLASPFVGAISDHYGPLRTVSLGAAVAGTSLIIAGIWQNSLTAFVVAYGVTGASGLTAMTYVPMGVLVDRLFEQRRTGLAYAIVTNGTSIGFIILSPFWLWLQPTIRWNMIFILVGIFFVIPIASGIWIISRIHIIKENFPVSLRDSRKIARTDTWRQIFSDPGFYALAIGFFGCGATMALIDVHLVAFWQDTHSPVREMSAGMILLGTFELTSGLATGWLAARYNRRVLLSVFYLLRSLSMLLLFSSITEVRILFFPMLFGASYLGTVVLTSMFCLERYGMEIKGQVFGLLFFVHQVGAFFAVQFGAITFDKLGSYQPLIITLTALTAVSSLAVWLGLRKPSDLTFFNRERI